MEAARQISSENHGGVERTTEPFKGITVDELNEKWKAAVDRLESIGIAVLNADHALEGALTIRYVAAPIVSKTRELFILTMLRLVLPYLSSNNVGIRKATGKVRNFPDVPVHFVQRMSLGLWFDGTKMSLFTAKASEG